MVCIQIFPLPDLSMYMELEGFLLGIGSYHLVEHLSKVSFQLEIVNSNSFSRVHVSAPVGSSDPRSEVPTGA